MRGGDDCHVSVSPWLSPSHSRARKAALGTLRQARGSASAHLPVLGARLGLDQVRGSAVREDPAANRGGRVGVQRGAAPQPPWQCGYSPQALAAGESGEGAGLPPDPALVVAVLPRALRSGDGR